jgi:hypothetical protein
MIPPRSFCKLAPSSRGSARLPISRRGLGVFFGQSFPPPLESGRHSQARNADAHVEAVLAGGGKRYGHFCRSADKRDDDEPDEGRAHSPQCLSCLQGRRPCTKADIALLPYNDRNTRVYLSLSIEILCFSPRCPQTVPHGVGLGHHSYRGVQRSRGTPCAASVLG